MDGERIQSSEPTRPPKDVQIILPWERYEKLQSGAATLLSSESPQLYERDQVRGMAHGVASQPNEQRVPTSSATVGEAPRYLQPKPKWIGAREQPVEAQEAKGRKRPRGKPSSQATPVQESKHGKQR